MHRTWIRGIAGGVIAAALVAGGAVAFAQTPAAAPASPQARLQAFLGDVAGHLGVQPAALQSALEAAEQDQVSQALAAGRIDAKRAQAIDARIAAGKIGGFGLLGRWNGRRWPFDLNAAASYLGLTQAQLRSDLQAGESLAAVAASQSAAGKSAQGLEQALLGAARNRLATAVQNGKLTAAQEQARLSKLQARLATLVNRVWKQG